MNPEKKLSESLRRGLDTRRPKRKGLSFQVLPLTTPIETPCTKIINSHILELDSDFYHLEYSEIVKQAHSITQDLVQAVIMLLQLKN